MDDIAEHVAVAYRLRLRVNAVGQTECGVGVVFKPQTCRAVLAVDDDVVARLSDAAVAGTVAPLGAPGRRRRAARRVAPARAPVAAAVAGVLACTAAPDACAGADDVGERASRPLQARSAQR
eukprot:scaffold58976_cov60-Phaeocystis_antarctica.AAC.1